MLKQTSARVDEDAIISDAVIFFFKKDALYHIKLRHAQYFSRRFKIFYLFLFPIQDI